MMVFLAFAGEMRVLGFMFRTLVKMSLRPGAGLLLLSYCGSCGANMILLLSTAISLFGCTMVSLILNGAISYAKLSQKPSNAQVEAQYMGIPGVPICPEMAVRITICPECFSRRRGRVALMKLTCPKKIVSNCARTRLWVEGLVDSSSTVPTTATQL